MLAGRLASSAEEWTKISFDFDMDSKNLKDILLLGNKEIKFNENNIESNLEINTKINKNKGKKGKRKNK